MTLPVSAAGTSADRPRDARSPEEPGRAQFPYAPPAAFTGTGASKGDVARLHILGSRAFYGRVRLYFRESTHTPSGHASPFAETSR